MSKEIKIVVIGGGSSYTPFLVQSLIDKHDEFRVDELWLVDIDEQAERLNIIYEFSKKLINEQKSDLKLFKSTKRRDALKHATYVVTQVNVGMYAQKLVDEKICYEHHMYASDIFGMSSVFNAIRTIPIIYQIIDEMNEVCQDAWMINLTQPMGLISEAVIRYAEFDKYIGISHVPLKVQSCFSDLLKIDESQLIIYAAGLSPITFMTHAFHKKKDKFRELMKIILKEENKCCWSKDFLKDFEVYPSTDLKYMYKQEDKLNEFIENFEHQKSESALNTLIENQLFDLYKKLNIVQAMDLLKTRSGLEQTMKTVELIESMITDKRDYQIINTINNGHLNDLPENSAIEISARITKDGPMPIHMSRIPNQIKGLLQHIKSFEELFADAIYEKDLNKILSSLKVHPLMFDHVQTKSAFETFIRSNEKYLAYYTKEQ